MELSPHHSSDLEDEEDEPLFADDIVNTDDEEEPPPLPPPMPTLSQLSQPHTRTPQSVRGGGGGGVGEGSATQGPPGADGGGGDQQDGSAEVAAATQKKRAPILTLTIDRIFSEKGLPCIEKEFPELKFKGKGHEAGDLCYLLQQYEHWANALYPKLTFKDVTDRIEKLATKKEFKSQLVQMRRRWARGPTPPLEDEDDSKNENGLHNDSSSSNNQHSSSVDPGRDKSQDSAVEGELSESENGPAFAERTEERESNSAPPSSDVEPGSPSSDVEPGSSSSDVEPVRRPLDAELDRRCAETGKNEVEEYEDLLMRESEIEREVRQEQRMRKRERTSPSIEDGAAKHTSESEVSAREGVKRSKLNSDFVDDELDSLLAEEDLLMHDTASRTQIPPEYDES